MDQTISIHALREEGDHDLAGLVLHGADISIHALREEGDLANLGEPAVLNQISIHALREEGDVTQRIKGAWPTYFYPRPPRGGRPERRADCIAPGQFLSTPSARRAT